MYFSKNEQRLDKPKKLTDQGAIKILSGAPILLEFVLNIGMFILESGRSVRIYTKIFVYQAKFHKVALRYKTTPIYMSILMFNFTGHSYKINALGLGNPRSSKPVKL